MNTITEYANFRTETQSAVRTVYFKSVVYRK